MYVYTSFVCTFFVYGIGGVVIWAHTHTHTHAQVGTRVCVEKGHHATVASVKRSARGSNFVDPYTEEEVDARYRLMLKPGEVRTVQKYIQQYDMPEGRERERERNWLIPQRILQAVVYMIAGFTLQ